MLARLAIPALALVLLAGCSTKRTLTIESNPPGAQVWVNGVDEGTTPAQVEFVHYAYFDVRMEMPGYEAVQTEVVVPSKIDGYPVVDLPFELMVRQRGFAWRATMKPIQQRSAADLQTFLDEASAFRQQTLKEAVRDAPPPPPRPRPRQEAASSR